MTSPSAGPAELARLLAAAGHLPPRWRRVFAAVDRGRFVPDEVWVRGADGYVPLSRAREPDEWRRCVYSDMAVITQVEDPPGADPAFTPSSSASMPRVVAAMLDHLDPRQGHRVLEIGTGTGYNAALLAEFVGDGHVVSVEVDAVLAAHARRALEAAGHGSRVVAADGADGWPEGAPYDRLIATCAVHRVPYAWVEQVAPGGRIVTPWGTGLHNGVLLRLDVREGPGGPEAQGPVVGDSAFMWMRAQAPARDVMATVRHSECAVAGRTRLDPRYPLGDADAAFAVGLMMPGVRSSVGHGPDGEWTLWLADAATGSWASVDYVPETAGGAQPSPQHAPDAASASRLSPHHAPAEPGFDVRQSGPRLLWDEVEAAYRRWERAGSPERTRYGLTVAAAGQRVWLDEPGKPYPA
ncbi:methyltransferase domain-containing protein [Streptomyces varsoviensis]|uniref:methyltransferase domain-containing protein n=1 Tax=Streptomyces varsoviensis TaxID=67373 RepID=UPI0034023C06